MSNGFKIEHLTTGAVVSGAEENLGAENATEAGKTPGDGFVLLGTLSVRSKVAAFLKSSGVFYRSWSRSVCLYARGAEGSATDAAPPLSIGLGFTDGYSAFFLPFEVPDVRAVQHEDWVAARDDYARRYAAKSLRIIFDSCRFESGAEVTVFYNRAQGVARLSVKFKNGVTVEDIGTDGLGERYGSPFPDLLAVVPSTADYGGLCASFDPVRIANVLAILAEIVGAKVGAGRVSFCQSVASKPATFLIRNGGVRAAAVLMPLGDDK